MWEGRVLRTWECQRDIHSPLRQYCGEVVGAFTQCNVACITLEVGVAQYMGRVRLRSPHMVGVAPVLWLGQELVYRPSVGRGLEVTLGECPMQFFQSNPLPYCVVSRVDLYILHMWLVMLWQLPRSLILIIHEQQCSSNMY